jgi:transcriptional regulator with XRE-family HTH domain
MTQQDLADATGLLQPSIARIESGAAIPRTATLISLLGATGHRLTVEPIGPEADREMIRERLRTPVAWRAGKALGRRAADRRRSPLGLLSRLRYRNVPFVLVGDLAEAIHGASGTVGRAVEICVADAEVARDRLRMAREDLGKLAEGGRLEVRQQTAAGDSYDVISRNAATTDVAPGITVRVAAIEDLVRDRLARGRPGDLDAAAELAAIAEER